MEERRKNKRTSMDSKLMIKRLDGDSHTEIDIEVTDKLLALEKVP